MSVAQEMFEEERKAHNKTKARLEKCEKLCKDLEFAYNNKDEDFPHGFEVDTLRDFKEYFENNKLG